jgi:hypothetical protein
MPDIRNLLAMSRLNGIDITVVGLSLDGALPAL